MRREGLTRDLPPGDNEDLRWVTNSATLILGDHDAVLVDTFTTIDQNEQLIQWVREHDRRLTHVYLTHGHGDHVYGIGQLLEAFPSATALATAGTLVQSRIQARDEYRDGFWGRLFPGQIPAVSYTHLSSRWSRLGRTAAADCSLRSCPHHRRY